VLALLPLANSLRSRSLLTSRRALVVALVASVALVAINGPGIFDAVERDKADYAQQAAQMVVLNLGPSVIPDDTLVRFDPFVVMRARHYRALVDRYGEVAGTHAANPDAALVKLTKIRPIPVNADTGTCVPLNGPTKMPRRPDIRRGAARSTRVVVRAPTSDVTVHLRRFEESSLSVGRIPAGTAAAFELPNLLAAAPWMLQADGACLIQP
jgi:hypothetical protein